VEQSWNLFQLSSICTRSGPDEVGTNLEQVPTSFQLRSNFTIGRSVASTYCVSLSGCPWPLGYLCADFCAQNQPRWPQALSCFRAHTTSPRQCSSRDPSRGGQPHSRTSLQHSSDGTVKKSGSWHCTGHGLVLSLVWSVSAPASRIGFDTTGRGSTCSRIFAVASILGCWIEGLLRLDDKLPTSWPISRSSLTGSTTGAQSQKARWS
jgi:hypothetical protein